MRLRMICRNRRRFRHQPLRFLTVVKTKQLADTAFGEREHIKPVKTIVRHVKNAGTDGFDLVTKGRTHRMVRCGEVGE